MIIRHYDKDHPNLLEFRKRAIIECGGTEDLVNYRGYHSNFLKICNGHRKEDIYRFTDEKWHRTTFDFIDCHYADDNSITNISGAMQYNNWMRGGVYHFGLREYRKKYPSVLFQTDGHLSKLIDYCKEKDLNGIFISIYPHENRLKAFSRALKKGTSIPTTGDIKLIRLLQYKGRFMFNDVEQDFFVIELNNTTFDYKDLLRQ